jgi:hypothetical protein
MAQNQPTEKIWLSDEKGNYYMLTQEILDSVKVPEDHKKEVEQVVNGQDETAGFTAFSTQTSLASSQLRPGSLSLGGTGLSVVGRCMCGRNFGVQSTLRR